MHDDLQSALGGAPTQQAPAPGPAAVSLDPNVAQQQGAVVAETPQPGEIGAVQMPPQQQQQQVPQQPVPQFQQQQVPQAPQQQVAPNAPNAPTFVNPDPNSAISEPPQFDAQGQQVPVVAPANQPAPVHPQVQAQEEHQQALEVPPTVQELSEAANVLRATGCTKVASQVDKVIESKIKQEEQQQQQQQQPQVQQPQQPQQPQQFGQGVPNQIPQQQGPFVTR